MKTRKGFVSNSSSSSFIVGIARIVDKAKFDVYVEKNGIVFDDYDVYVASTENDKCDLSNSGDKMIVESFQLSASAKIKKPTDEFFVVNISNDEGDSPFWQEGSYDYDYEIDIGYFGETQQKAYAAFFDVESGLEMASDVSYGAGRNG